MVGPRPPILKFIVLSIKISQNMHELACLFVDLMISRALFMQPRLGLEGCAAMPDSQIHSLRSTPYSLALLGPVNLRLAM